MIQSVGADELIASNFTYTASTHAILNGNVAAVQVLYEQTNFDLNTQGKTGNSLLMFAARWNQLAIVQYLLSHGADLTATNAQGETALAIARKQGNQSVVELLLANGATK